MLLSLGCDEPPIQRVPWYLDGSASAVAPATGSAAATSKLPLPPAKTGYARLDRATFNKMAARLNLPVYWASDANKDNKVDPAEVASLLFFPTEGKWVESGKFTEDFSKAYEELVKASKAGEPKGEDAERLKQMLGELDAASSVLVRTNMAGMSDTDVTFVRHMVTASKLLDELYAQQLGLAQVADKVAPDAASQSVFRRNWGPLCKTPTFEKNKDCTAAPGVTDVPVDSYPAALQSDADFCKKIEDAENNKDLMKPFAVVRDDGGKLVAKSNEEAYGEAMKKVAAELRAAATDMTDPAETALVDYLNEAANGFESNKWEKADEAWAKMNARNSKWYLRIAPDETYWEPCSLKAGFHMSFAKINTSSLELQDKLAPLQQQMEDDLAALIGEPYKARKVTFHLPDFIDIVLNAGDSRDPVGATIGQSLPNWGPVANEGRGRTVAMTNLYTDPDSMVVRRAKAASLLSEATMKVYVDEGGPGLLGTVLHEATHNLGPSHEYKVDGKKDDEAFGGDLASMLEELKAQSGAYYYLWLVQEKGVITEADAHRSLVDSLVWGLNHISRGMYLPNGKRKAYSQLAAIQIGFFMDEGAITWDPNAKTSSGEKGSFTINFDKMKDASIKLMKTVAAIKAKGDKAGAIALADKYVEKATSKVPHDLITERLLKHPQPNFVYAIDFP
ncbi:MAG: hypothetical protein HOW73_32745 [Polyangiaceae bacterium]|nr:hypothetical protein [Polyangiaceae bacterium]